MSKILIVDDAAFMRMVLRDTLAEAGYKDTCEAANGRAAIKVYKDEKPDLVLMDMTMPVMDGIKALKSIKALNENAKVVMCSAMGQESMVAQAIKDGAIDFIVKPFRGERLIQTVKTVLGD